MNKIIVKGLIISVLFLTGIVNAQPTDGLIHYWPFNNGLAEDVEGSQNGTVYGAIPTADRFGNPNSALYYDGVDDYVYLHQSNCSIWQYTYSVWFKPTGNITTNTFQKIWADIPIEMSLYYRQSDHINNPNTIAIYAGGQFNYVTPNYFVELNNWYHIIVTYDYYIDQTARVYINGELLYSKVCGPISIYSSVGSFSYNQAPVNGIIDDARIYIRGLSENEISQLFLENVTHLPVEVYADSNGTLKTSTSEASYGYLRGEQVIDVPVNGRIITYVRPDYGYEIDYTSINGRDTVDYSPRLYDVKTYGNRIEAYFKLTKWRLLFTTNGPGTIEYGPTVEEIGTWYHVEHEQPLTVNFIPDSNGVLDSVQIMAQGDSVYRNIGAPDLYALGEVTDEIHARVYFSVKKNTITASSNHAGGHITPEGSTILDYGGSQTYIISADQNVLIDSVVVDGISVGPVETYTFENVTESHTIEAHFSDDPNPRYTVSVACAGPGNLVGGVTSYVETVDAGDTCTIVVYADIGKDVFQIMHNGEITTYKLFYYNEFSLRPSGYTIENIHENHGVFFSFGDALPKHMIQTWVQPQAYNRYYKGGTINPEGEMQMPDGSELTIDITPDYGYYLDSLTVDHVSQSLTESYTFENISYDHYLGVWFKPTEARLSAQQFADMFYECEIGVRDAYKTLIEIEQLGNACLDGLEVLINADDIVPTPPDSIGPDGTILALPANPPIVNKSFALLALERIATLEAYDIILNTLETNEDVQLKGVALNSIANGYMSVLDTSTVPTKDIIKHFLYNVDDSTYITQLGRPMSGICKQGLDTWFGKNFGDLLDEEGEIPGEVEIEVNALDRRIEWWTDYNSRLVWDRSLMKFELE